MDKWHSLREEISKVECVLHERFDYIAQKIFEVFECDVQWYDLRSEDYDNRDLDGSFETSLNGEEFNFHYELKNTSKKQLYDAAIIDKHNGEYGLDGCFPIRWFMEDFEQELIEGKKKYEDKKLKKKENSKKTKEKNKLEKQKLTLEAKKKLSKEELKALGVK